MSAHRTAAFAAIHPTKGVKISTASDTPDGVRTSWRFAYGSWLEATEEGWRIRPIVIHETEPRR